MANDTQTEADLRKTAAKAELRKTVADAKLADRQRQEYDRPFYKKPALITPLLSVAMLAFGVFRYTQEMDSFEMERRLQKTDQYFQETRNMLLEYKRSLLKELQTGLMERIESLIEHDTKLNTTHLELHEAFDALATEIDKSRDTVAKDKDLTLGQREKIGKLIQGLQGKVKSVSGHLNAKPFASPGVREWTQRHFTDLYKVDERLRALNEIRMQGRADGADRPPDDGG